MCWAPHMLSETTPVSVFCCPALLACDCASTVIASRVVANAMVAVRVIDDRFMFSSFIGSVGSSIVLFCRKRPTPQRSLLPQDKEHGNQDQYVNGRSNHSAHHGSGDGLHYIGADAGLPQNGNQTGQNRRNG